CGGGLAGAVCLNRRAVAGEGEPRQRERDGGIALRAERAHADHAALEIAAVFTPGAEKKVKRITLLKEPMVRISPPARLMRITEDKPTCMTSSRPACSSAAPRLPPLMLMMSTLSP